LTGVLLAAAVDLVLDVVVLETYLPFLHLKVMMVAMEKQEIMVLVAVAGLAQLEPIQLLVKQETVEMVQQIQLQAHLSQELVVAVVAVQYQDHLQLRDQLEPVEVLPEQFNLLQV
jgi:hypothetical protein